MGYHPRHALVRKLSRTGLAVGAAALAVAASAALTASDASATTLTCTNVNNALVSPFGCGGLQSGVLDLAHVNNVYNGLVTVQADASTTTEDWTAFAVEPPSTINGSDHVVGGPGGYGEYVAMVTLGGNIPSFTVTADSTVTSAADPGCVGYSGETLPVSGTNQEPCAGAKFTAGPNDLCLSVEKASGVSGTNGKLRWWTVLRSCNTNGTFVYGSATAPGTVSGGHYNAYQAWAPVGPESGGFLMDNVWLRQHSNNPYVLDITGDGGAGTATQAYQGGGSAWEEWNIIGCTPPASLLNVTAPYVNCP